MKFIIEATVRSHSKMGKLKTPSLLTSGNEPNVSERGNMGPLTRITDKTL